MKYLQIMINQQNPSSETLKLLQQILSLKLFMKEQRLKNKVLSLIKDKTISLQMLENASSQSQKIYGPDSPYIQIFFQKSQNDPSPQKIKQQIIASALYPFDLESYYYPQNLYKTSERIAIQLFYSLAYQHPCAAINLRSYISSFSNNQQIKTHPLRQIVLSVQCDFSPEIHCKIIKIHLDEEQISKQNQQSDSESQKSEKEPISNKSGSSLQKEISIQQSMKGERRKIMKVEMNDQYLDSYADYDMASQWYDSIIKKIEKAGILKIGQKEIIVKIKDYKMITLMEV